MKLSLSDLVLHLRTANEVMVLVPGVDGTGKVRFIHSYDPAVILAALAQQAQPLTDEMIAKESSERHGFGDDLLSQKVGFQQGARWARDRMAQQAQPDDAELDARIDAARTEFYERKKQKAQPECDMLGLYCRTHRIQHDNP